MNTMTKSVLIAAIAALAVTPLLAKSGGRQGTNILHFNVKVAFVNGDNTGSNSAAGASGTLTATEAIQGSADKESMTVSAKGLIAGEPYEVIGFSNSVAFSDGTPFAANSKGDLKVKFGTGKKNAAIFADASQLQEVDIVDDSSNGPVTVLTANFTNGVSEQYMVKEDISSDTGGTNGGNVTATLNIKSTLNKGTSKSLVTVTASGLQGGSLYQLVFNGTTVATNTAVGSKGTLKISSSDTPPNILDLTSVVVEDSGGNPVTATAILP